MILAVLVRPGVRRSWLILGVFGLILAVLIGDHAKPLSVFACLRVCVNGLLLNGACYQTLPSSITDDTNVYEI